MALWGLLAAALQSPGGQRDVRSIPSIHWGAFLNNSADPGNFFGGSGSNVGANLTNPAGFGIIKGNEPNNNVNPSAQSGYGETAPGAPPTSFGMTGFAPGQDAAMFAAYQNFLKNLGAPMGAPPLPQPRQPAPPIVPGAGGRLTGGDSSGMGGGGYRGPMPGSGGTGMMNFGNLSALSRFNGAQPMPYFST